ncbi:MAG TPA: photosynthetic reaction center cytochrome c subunit family protein [Candidatus Acidoferrales bacterium]|jgi:outer membrane lipoprotein-sorting protein|nr:photosynthetic reaction center cytochrome c subunit family protein [Candidatus Acidoferrales bacterium]
MATMVLCLLANAAARSQSTSKTGADQKPQMSEEAFKNIQVLRGIPVNEFMGTMGFFAASLGMNCTDCHGDDSAGSWDKYADDTPLKQTARRMVLMENLINRADFGAVRMVTCYTCHRGIQHPEVTPSLDEQYGPPPPADSDRVEPLPNAPDSPSAAEQILDKFIQAVGGAQQLAKLNSFTAKGTYSGFDTEFQKVAVEIFAKAPNQRATTVHASAGDDTTTYDGRDAWLAATNKPVPLIMLVGGDLDGAVMDADLSFPALLKQDLSKWHAGFPPVKINDRAVQVVEGTAPGGTQVKLYFDKESGLLVRQARFMDTAVGLTPLNVDYSDYREVSGVKMPFKWTVTWVDGQSTTELSNVQPNAPVAAAKFAKPAPAVARGPASK